MLYRSRRLEALLGGPLDAVTYADLMALVDNPEAAEAEDLDFKQELLADTEEKKAELAKDVAAFANHVGGVLVVGMADARGIPSKVMDADVSDRLRRHLQQVVAANTAPPVRFDMRPVPNPDPTADGRGFLLIAVPRSPHGPHAVTAPLAKATKEALRYPRRAASKTDWLTETDVATAYQRRFTASADRTDRLATVERELLAALPPSNQPHLIVSLTPEVPGDMTINRQTFARYEQELLDTKLLIQSQSAFDRVRIGSRRLITTGGDPNGYHYSHCDLHRDGSASWALHVAPHTSTVDGTEFCWTEPDTVVWLLMSALHVLALHARDRAGATGTALVEAALVEAPHTHPAGPPRPQMVPMLPLRIDGMRINGSHRLPLSTQFCAYADGDAAALLDDLAEEGPALVQTTSLLADEIVQAFGITEAPPITRSGKLRQSGWGLQLRTHMAKWANDHGIEVLSS
ncbi:helix-turn-helix domain-containing protein [Streptomyces sp. NPDC058864]